MRKLISIFASKIKGREIVIDENIPLNYIFITGISFFIGILRGTVTIGLGSKGELFVRGSKVKLLCKSKIHFGENVRLDSNVLLDGLSKLGIRTGRNVTLGSNTIIKCTGSLNDIGKGIEIGDNFGCGEFCFFGSAGGIKIGNDVIMGQSVRFHAQNHYYANKNRLIREQGTYEEGISIGDNCWIGSGVVFLDAVTVGNGCVIGANTVVNNDIPENSIAVGNPVKVIKKR